MMELRKLTREEYEQVVPESFLQSFQWGEFLLKTGKDVTHIGGFVDERRVVSAQMVIHDNSLGQYGYIPHGPTTEDSKHVQEFYSQLKQIHTHKVFFRVEPLSSDLVPAHGKKVRNIQPAKTLILDLAKAEEALLAEMHQKTRYNIRLAEKHSVHVRELTTKEEQKAALSLIKKTEERQGYTGHPVSYYELMIQNMNAKVFGAFLGEKLLSAGLFLDFGQTRTYLFGGSSDEDRNVMAPYLLHWIAIQEAKRNGLSKYDFWGIETSSGDVPGFARFKLGFGGEVVQYPGAYDIVEKGFTYQWYTALRAVRRLLKPIL